MSTTYWVLIATAVIWGALALLGMAAYALTLSEALKVVFGDESGAIPWASAFISEFVIFLVLAALAYLAAQDLKSIPVHVQERFGFKSLGWLGWLGILMIFSGLWNLVEQFNFYFGGMSYQLVNFRMLIQAIVGAFDWGAICVWIGALSLYARFRWAANKRLASAHTP